MGVLLENLAAAALHSYALHAGLRLHHWKHGKHEVDLVLDHPTHPLAMEIGSSTRHSTKGLEVFVQEHPRFAGRAYLVTPQSPVRPAAQAAWGIGSLPFDTFVLAVGRQAEQALRTSLAASGDGGSTAAERLF